MIVSIGSINPIKVNAVEEVIKNYPELSGAQIIAYAVSSEVSEQPLTLEEIIKGAKNRAKNSFDQCGVGTYSFGIESGLFEAMGTQTGFLEACVCSIYDGNNYYLGTSCGFEVPSTILKFVLENKKDLSQACYASGITTNQNLGSAEGLIGVLSKGHINRNQYTQQSIVSALIQIQNLSLYNITKNT